MNSYSLTPCEIGFNRSPAFTVRVDGKVVGYIGLVFPNNPEFGQEWMAMKKSRIRDDNVVAKAKDAATFAAATGIRAGLTKDEAIRYVLGAQSWNLN